jgi:hypothetical protein
VFLEKHSQGTLGVKNENFKKVSKMAPSSVTLSKQGVVLTISWHFDF